MTPEELEEAFVRIGAVQWDEESARRFHHRMELLEANGLGGVLHQFGRGASRGDFLGRVFEVNLGALLLEAGLQPRHAVKQWPPKDIDYAVQLAGHEVNIELKRLGRHANDEERIRRQVAGEPIEAQEDDGRTIESDIGRVQRDIFDKAAKFNPKIPAGAVNLVAVDVCELVGGMMDVGDCLCAAGGLPLAAKHYRDPFPNPVGVFEEFDPVGLGESQRRWVEAFHQPVPGVPHPKGVLHGVWFLFRDPPQRIHLGYDLHGCLVWNPRLAGAIPARDIGAALQTVVPFVNTRP